MGCRPVRHQLPRIPPALRGPLRPVMTHLKACAATHSETHVHMSGTTGPRKKKKHRSQLSRESQANDACSTPREFGSRLQHARPHFCAKSVRWGHKAPWWSAHLFLCITCFWTLPASRAATLLRPPACDVEKSFRVNEVISQCKATNLGAMPMGVTATSMAFDFRELASDANRLSLVRSTMSTYIDCAELADNSAQASATASGHMRPTPGTTGSLVSILAEDVAAAADAMREGVYDVCFYRASASAWTNMGIGLVVQNQLLGLEVLGLSHGNGTRLAVPLDTLHPIVIRPSLPDGTMPAENDRITMIAVNEDCAAAPALVPLVPDEERPAASGYLNFSIDRAQFVGGHVLATLSSRWYQVCFSKAGGPFSKTGIGLFVQHDVSAVTVNGVTPNRGADVSVPPVRASEILLHRVVPRLGYHQVL